MASAERLGAAAVDRVKNDAGEGAAAGRQGPAAITVEVVYSPAPQTVDRVELKLAAGTTLLHAVRLSGLLTRHAAIDPAVMAVGIWGRPASWSQSLAQGDRVELYRPLQVDPKEARRLRYRAQGERGRRKPGSRG